MRHKTLRYKPSEVAAAGLYLANRIRKSGCPWPRNLREITGLEEQAFVKPSGVEGRIWRFLSKPFAELSSQFTAHNGRRIAPPIGP